MASTSIKESMMLNILEFVKQSNTNELGYSPYINYYKGLNVKTSFGQGTPARISWISIRGEKQQTSKGIYVSILYFKHNHKFVLAYGVSEENKPDIIWNLPAETKTIETEFINRGYGKPPRYKKSFLYKVYDDYDLDYAGIVSDIDFLIETYKDILEENHLPRETAFVAPDPKGNGKKREFYDESYVTVASSPDDNPTNKTWIVPSNNDIFRLLDFFKEKTEVDWSQNVYKYEVGDIVYIYHSTKLKRILHKVEVIKTDIPTEDSISDSDFFQPGYETKGAPYVRFRKLEALSEEDTRLSYDKLKKNGLTSQIQGPMTIDGKSQLLDYIKSVFENTNVKEEKVDYKIETAVKITDKKTPPRYWIYSPGDQACKWSICKNLEHMSLGWEEMGNLSEYATRNAMVDNLRVVYNQPKSSFKNASLALWQFVHDMKVGDIIFVKKGRSTIVGRGIVTGNYKFDESLDDFNNVRSVNWTHSGEWDAPWGLPMKTLTRIGESYEYLAEQLENLFSNKKKLKQIPFDVKKAKEFINETGLLYEDDFFKRFVYSLQTKPFVIMSGLAGSGKTQLALAFAKAMVEDEKKQLRVVSVGADWTNREPLLGYPNALKDGEYVRPESGALDLLIECNKETNKNKPYFLILDEMNLSYVERYFADFLSAMESHHNIPLWDAEMDNEEIVPESVALPKNLFIIGTINVDETTYMFSPKVLDRANVIEFKVSADEMANFLDKAPVVDVTFAEGKAANMADDFVKKAAEKVDASTDANDVLKKFFKELKKVNAEFGYRTAAEIGRFISLAKDDMGLEKAIDAAIVQKLLPKLHGSRKKMVDVLKALFALCVKDGQELNLENVVEVDATLYKYPISADKIARMYNTAITNGYTSFAEA